MSANTIRLHIKPFSADLLSVVLPASVLQQARNISYHSLQTSPESSYGYVDLPAMEAERVKKKLNGAILKGKKMSIEEARPSKRRRQEADAEDQDLAESAKDSAPKPKKPKKEPKIVDGHELSPDRKVKRGWTDSKAEKAGRKSKKDQKERGEKKQQSASKYTNKDELLFRAKVPPNRAEADGKKTKKKGDAGIQIVHEFEKSTAQPSFLRGGASGGSKAASYVDGKGWVDEEGQLVEAEKAKPSRRRTITQPAGTTRSTKKSKDFIPSVEGSETSSSGESSTSSDSDSEPLDTEGHVQSTKPVTKSQLKSFSKKDDTSSSDSDSSSASSAQFSQDNRNDAPSISVATTQSSAEEQPVHPLEALFKKPKKPSSSSQDKDVAKPSLEVSTSFSFFDTANRDDIDDEEPIVPGTPFSSQDVRSRGLRSAAPTPDTAYPTRWNSYGSTMSERLGSEAKDDQGQEEDEMTPVPQKTRADEGDSSKPESEWEKQFWEKRGDNNRAWKQQRKEALKEKRRAENRTRKRRNW